MLQSLQGKKTYIVATCAALYAIFGFLSGHLDSVTAIQTFFGSLAVMGIRSGITTEIQNLLSLLPDKTLPTAAPLGAAPSPQGPRPETPPSN